MTEKPQRFRLKTDRNRRITMNQLRIAWLIPSAFYYWQPMFREVTRRFPQTRIFAGKWPGFAAGLEDTFTVEVVGERKVIPIIPAATGYGYSFTYLSLGIASRLLQFRPQLIFTSSFGMWTLLVLLLQPLGRWRVVIAYEGSSPSVDFRHSPVRLRLRQAMVRAAAACITNSQAGRRYLIDSLQAKPERVFVQPYEVAEAESLSGEATPETEAYFQDRPRPIFLFVGGLIPRKGVQQLLAACRILQEQGCQNYTLVVVGDGPQRSQLEAFCQDHNLAERVVWTGRVNYDQIGACFRLADVFVLPTLEDTWGMVVLEAMAVGKPVLCSKWAGASELVVLGENGYVFDAQAPEELAALMRQLIDDPAAIAALGAAAQERMAAYTPAAAAEFLAEVTAFAMGDRT